jgi:Txe/YoeB family toxin of Txe-Axe toxin-antitoxin module
MLEEVSSFPQASIRENYICWAEANEKSGVGIDPVIIAIAQEWRDIVRKMEPMDERLSNWDRRINNLEETRTAQELSENEVRGLIPHNFLF